MTSVPWWDKSRNYFLCRLCGKVLRMNRIQQVPHCGELPKMISDREARARVEGKRKGPRFGSVVTRRGADDLETAERRVRYNKRFRDAKKRGVK